MAAPRARWSVAALLVGCAAAASACGGGVEEGKIPGRAGGEPVADARVVEVEASNFAFAPDTLRAEVGEELALTLRSVDSPHDFAIDGLGRVVDVGGDETAAGRLRIDDAGRYRFSCTVPGHRAGGMEGTITVG